MSDQPNCFAPTDGPDPENRPDLYVPDKPGRATFDRFPHGSALSEQDNQPESCEQAMRQPHTLVFTIRPDPLLNASGIVHLPDGAELRTIQGPHAEGEADSMWQAMWEQQCAKTRLWKLRAHAAIGLSIVALAIGFALGLALAYALNP